jgi:hypothetical protein
LRPAAVAEIALAFAIASSAMAQSTVVMPLPGGNGYTVVPPRQGFTTQVLPMFGGWLIVPPGPQGRSMTILPLPEMALPPRHHSPPPCHAAQDSGAC